MKPFTCLPLAFFVLLACCCTVNKQKPTVFKGRLEEKGICMNYTIRVMEGKIDTSLIEASWTNPSTGVTHQDVFRLGSPCNFPSSIEEGQEFYFVVEKTDQDCAVCRAYYPTPSKALSIKIVDPPSR